MIKVEELKKIREEVNRKKSNILKLKVRISDLKLNRNVALFAYARDKVIYGEDVHENIEIMNSLKDDSRVIEYLELQDQLDEIKDYLADYYYLVQIDLREGIEDIDPDIYTYYGYLDDDEIIKNIVTAELEDYDEKHTIILPPKELKSKRKLRHFYNRVSFKYLEGVVIDNDTSLDNKRLGKVKIINKKS